MNKVIKSKQEYTVQLRDMLSTKVPFKNKLTNEIKYMDYYDRYIVQKKNYRELDWVEIQDSPTLRLLYARS